MSGNERFQQQLAVLNARVQNVNLTFNDLLHDMNEPLKTHAARIGVRKRKRRIES